MSSSSPDGELLIEQPAPHVARLVISNPGKRGALDRAILDRFADVIPALDARCVIITGREKIFSAGYDIGDLPQRATEDKAERLLADPFAGLNCAAEDLLSQVVRDAVTRRIAARARLVGCRAVVEHHVDPLRWRSNALPPG